MLGCHVIIGLGAGLVPLATWSVAGHSFLRSCLRLIRDIRASFNAPYSFDDESLDNKIIDPISKDEVVDLIRDNEE